jgi:putative DNA primase/helicase
VSITEGVSTLNEGLERLERVQEEGSNYRAECPACGSHSLWITPATDDSVLYNCKRGCEQAEVTEKLHELGIFFPSSRERYVYEAADGTKLFIKHRFRKDGEQRKRQWYQCYAKSGLTPATHNSKKKGTWSASGCKICKRKKLPIVLYHLPEVVAAIEARDVIYLCEGEKDAEAIRDHKAVATSTENGASDWNSTYAGQLDGAKAVIIIADNDDAGKRGALNRYLSLKDHAESVTVVYAREGKDAYDHFAFGHGLNDFVEADIHELEELAQISNGEIDSDDPIMDEPWTQYGYANRFVALHGEEVVFDGTHWRYWDDACWREDEHNRILRMSARLSRRMSRVSKGYLNDKGREIHGEFVQRQESSGAVSATLALAKSELTLPPDWFDNDSTLLVCRSGIYAGGGAFKPHEPLSLYTKCIPIYYDPEATCPTWDAFLRTSIPDASQRRYFQTLIGFGLAGGDRRKKRVINLIGPKDTGKSTFLGIFEELLGPYIAHPAVEELVSHKGRRQSDKFALSELRGSRFAVASEIEKFSTFRVAPLKALTGGDMIQTQSKYGQPVSWRASVMLLIATNERIMFDVEDDAFAERQIDIVFRRTRKIDRSLGKQLDAEKAGIWNWILAGVDNYLLRDELKEPASIKRGREAAETEVSIPFQFLQHGFDAGNLVRVQPPFPASKCCDVKKLFLLYVGWCETEGIRGYPRQREFSRIIQRRYKKRDNCSDGKNHFLGIAFDRDTEKQ